MSARSRARPWFNDRRFVQLRADLVHQPPVPSVRALLLSWMTPAEVARLEALERVAISPGVRRELEALQRRSEFRLVER